MAIKNIRNIGFFEAGTNTLIKNLKIAKGNKRPITFQASDLAYVSTTAIYYQAFSELWVKAKSYAEDFNLSGLQFDLGFVTEAVTDIHDLNVTNVGEGFVNFDLNTSTAS